MPADDAAVFTLTFSQGLADRNRLPFDQVIKTLTEFQELVRELGKRVQAAAGQSEPTGDFGLEVVAGAGAHLLKKGSVVATVVATRDVANASRTFELVLNQAKDYSKKPTIDESIEGSMIARRMLKIARLQVASKSLVAFQMRGGPNRVPKATLDERAYQHLVKSSKKLMSVEGLQLFGRLRQLKDLSRKEDGDGHFWGELVTDGHESWRLRFHPGDLPKVLPLFMQQVSVVGEATYFGPARAPRLKVTAIEPDPDRDYVKAFDDLRATGMQLFGESTTEELLAELYG